MKAKLNSPLHIFNLKNVVFITALLSFTLFSFRSFAQTTPWVSPAIAKNVKNPISGDKSVLADAKILYINDCGPCHGDKGKGDGPAAIALNPKPSDHTSAVVQNETDGSLFWKISEGRNSMPSYKKTLTDKQIWELVNYIRTLSKSTSQGALPNTVNIPKVQQTAVDSTVINRISTLEREVASQKSGESHFMVVGVATFGYARNKTIFTAPGAPGNILKTNSFGDANNYELSPMLLWRHGNNFLIEFEPSFDGNGLGVNWANISYFATPGLIIHGGYFVVPFGIYNKRLAAGWMNKLAGDPMGFDLPGTDFGIGLSGGLPLGSMKWTYDVSLTNGLQLLPDGELQNAGIVDNNQGKMVSGRVSLLPFSNSSLELGASGLYSNAGDAGSKFATANVKMFGADLNFVKTVNIFLINIKGQYNRINVTRQNYISQTDSSLYSFNNKTSSSFAQLSFRPVGINNKLIKNFELAYRYSNYTTPAISVWGQSFHENAFGLDYWISWRTVLKFTYAISHTLSTANILAGGTPGVTDVNSASLQFSIQF